MLYTASFLNPSHHHGKILSIAFMETPSDYDGVIMNPLIPSQIWDAWKNSSQSSRDWSKFKACYLAELNQPRSQDVIRWLSGKALTEDITLCTDTEPHQQCYRFILADVLSSKVATFAGNDIHETQVERLTRECKANGHNIQVVEKPSPISGFRLYRIWHELNMTETTENGAYVYLSNLLFPYALEWKKRLSR